MSYNPTPKVADILDRGMQHIQSVPYRVTLRWVFYRLLQVDHVFKVKEDYLKLKGYTSKARKSWYGGWSPTTLADDTRSAVMDADGYVSVDDWGESVRNGIACTLSKYTGQKHAVILGFEARGMRGQFETYAPGVNLFPFGGDTSIEMKWKLARAIEDAGQELPVTFLYFGDLDPKGAEIFLNAMRDVVEWGPHFEHKWAGLTVEQVIDVPENPDRPGEYQWVGLSDEQAATIISEALDGLWDAEAYQATLEKETEAEDSLVEYLKGWEL